MFGSRETVKIPEADSSAGRFPVTGTFVVYQGLLLTGRGHATKVGTILLHF
jgi:hypothetical protein